MEAALKFTGHHLYDLCMEGEGGGEGGGGGGEGEGGEGLINPSRVYIILYMD